MAFTWLNKIGTDLIHFFEKAVPVAQEVDAIAAPFINAVAPELQSAISIGLTEIAKVEALGVAASNTTGSNSVKLAAVISAVAPQISPLIASLGGKAPTATQYTNFINGLVSAANAFEMIEPLVASVITVAAPSPVTAPQTGAVVTLGK